MDIITQIKQLNPLQLEAFLFVLCRLGGLFLDAPLLSNRNIPAMVKIGLLFFMSMIVFPFVPINGLSLHSNNLLFLGAIVREVSIGLIIGFAARLLFAGIQIAGQLIDYEMGFGFVNVVDPESRLQIPIMGQFLYIFAIFIFLLIDGHHWLVQAMVKSF